MAHNCPECGTVVADDDRIVCEECDSPTVADPDHWQYCPCCATNVVQEPLGPFSRCEGCRAGDDNRQCDPAITGHETFYPERPLPCSTQTNSPSP